MAFGANIGYASGEKRRGRGRPKIEHHVAPHDCGHCCAACTTWTYEQRQRLIGKGGNGCCQFVFGNPADAPRS